jgi:transcriptional regulator with XRE-family HTH domain
MNMANLGEKLRELRGNMSLREAAKTSGLSFTYIRCLERNSRPGSKTPIKPTPESLKCLSSTYDVSYEFLMEIAGYIDRPVGEEFNNRTDIVELLKSSNSLTFKGTIINEEQRNKIIQLIPILLKK